MNRPGCVPHHSYTCQSLYALTIAVAMSSSFAEAKTRPAKPGIDGKQSDPSTPPAFMSLMRSSTFQQPGAHLVEAGRLDAVLLAWSTGHRVQPDVGDDVVVVVPGEGAVFPLLQLRSELLVLRRQVLLEDVWRLDDVIVDAHQDQFVLVHRSPIWWRSTNRPAASKTDPSRRWLR